MQSRYRCVACHTSRTRLRLTELPAGCENEFCDSMTKPAKTASAAAMLAILLAGFVVLARHSVTGEPYFYDEADYLVATERGPLANALETSAIPIPALIDAGLHRGRASGQKAALSEWLRDSNDISFYRHWHGPLMFYYLDAVDAIAGRNERVNREAMLVFPLLTLLVAFCGCFLLLPESMQLPGAALTTALVSWHYVSVQPSEVAPHQLFALTFITSLVLLGGALKTGRRGYWYLSVAVAALAFVTMEVAFILVLVLLAAAWKERKALGMNIRLALKSAALFAGIVVILWPAALLRLSFLKGYMLHAYMAVFRKAVWGEVTLGGTWVWRLTHNPVHWALLIVSIVLFFRMKDLPTRRVAWPFLLYGCLMLLLVMRVATVTPRYDLPFAQAFDFFTGLVLTAALCRLRTPVMATAVAAICVSCFVATVIALGPRHEAPSRSAQVLEAVRREGVAGDRLLVPHDDLPVLHYYFPGAKLRPYDNAGPTAAELNDSDVLVETGLPVRIDKLRGGRASSVASNGDPIY